jgi:hypothetical protein
MGTEEVEAMVEDMEKDPLATDIPLHVLFANDRVWAQGMGTKEVEATVEDIEEDQSYRYPPHMYLSMIVPGHWYGCRGHCIGYGGGSTGHRYSSMCVICQ